VKKVLIAEDDVISQKIIVKVVESLGHMTFISPHGKHAYETLVANQKFDLLITDIMMPYMNGMELVKVLKGDVKFKDMGIIMVSSVVGVNEIHDLLDMGVNFFHPKPLKMNFLKKDIQSLLS